MLWGRERKKKRLCFECEKVLMSGIDYKRGRKGLFLYIAFKALDYQCIKLGTLHLYPWFSLHDTFCFFFHSLLILLPLWSLQLLILHLLHTVHHLKFWLSYTQI
ncbi:hypothetical protein Lalb_Chr05g0212121 [Lupinus albus]|uniref:Uncharacterized protein n=1 Tax=Lupinus albus TaxID=3870 RepID=A0A6A4QGW2_LUPAL|nr:hypothetical protein Lalb_Chr05g0212121 [Lupinus albus]